MDLQQKQSDDDLSTTLLRALETNPCFLVDRTTGLGKSYTCADVTMQYLIKGKRVIYIYPGKTGLAQFSGYLHTFLERYVKDDAPDKIASLLARFTPISYAKLLNSFKSNPEELGVLLSEQTLCIFDEAHKMGGRLTQRACAFAIDVFKEKGIHYIGCTATRDRKDRFDVLSTFFQNVLIAQLTLNEALQSNMLVKPRYVYAIQMFDADVFLSSPRGETFTMADLSSMEIASISVRNMWQIIQEQVKIVYGDHLEKSSNKGFRILVFCNFIDTIAQKRNEIIESIHKAFSPLIPRLRIHSLLVASAEVDVTTYPKSEYAWEEIQLTDDLEELKKPVADNVIEVIFSVKKLMDSIHCSPNAAILTYPTYSNINYYQMLGRVLQRNSPIQPLIFDFGNNISLHPELYAEFFGKGAAAPLVRRILSALRTMDATVRVAEIREIVARSMHISMANLASVEETIMSTLSNPEMRQCLTPQMLCETYGLSLEALDYMLAGHGLSLEDLASESLENLPESGTKDAAE